MRKFMLAAAMTLLGGAASALTISNIVFNIDTSSTLDFGDSVEFSFDYVSESTDPDVMIFGRPLVSGAMPTDYASHMSPIYLSGTAGNAVTGYFIVNFYGEPEVLVDQVRFQAMTVTSMATLEEVFVDTAFLYVDLPEAPIPATLPLFATALLGAGAYLRRKG